MFSKSIILTTNQLQLSENFSYDEFVSWATRKLKGYSVKDVDILAKKVVAIDSHEKKIEVIEKITEAIESVKKKIEEKTTLSHKSPSDSELKKELAAMKEHETVLETLLSRAKSFDAERHAREEQREKAPEDKPQEENRDRPIVISDRS